MRIVLLDAKPKEKSHGGGMVVTWWSHGRSRGGQVAYGDAERSHMVVT